MSRKSPVHDKKFWIRVVCIVLVGLLAGSYILAALIS